MKTNIRPTSDSSCEARSRRKQILQSKKKNSEINKENVSNIDQHHPSSNIPSTPSNIGINSYLYEGRENATSIRTPLSDVTNNDSPHNNSKQARSRRKRIMEMKKSSHRSLKTSSITPFSYPDCNSDNNASIKTSVTALDERVLHGITPLSNESGTTESVILDCSSSSIYRDHQPVLTETQTKKRKFILLNKESSLQNKENVTPNVERSNHSKFLPIIRPIRLFHHSEDDSNILLNSPKDGGSITEGDVLNSSIRDNIVPDDNFLNQSTISRISSLYQCAEDYELLDIGDPIHVCFYCGANMWSEEKTGKIKDSTQPAFSLCCMKGKVELPHLPKPPDLLYNLMTDNDPRSKHFKENIRAYNSMFSFTSIGGKVLTSMNDGGGPPQFILSGQNYHLIGTLVPRRGQRPKFAQLYLYDTQNEITNRMSHFRSIDNGEGLDITLVQDLKEMIDKHNVLAAMFRRVRDHLSTNGTTHLSLRLFRGRGKDPRTYNLPTCDEVAALIIGDIEDMEVGRDVVVKLSDGNLSSIHETHTAFIPLQYPLLFPYGEDGFREDIPLSDLYNMASNRRHRVTLREFIAYRIQERNSEYGNVVNSRRLFQQFAVDTYTMIESQRLSFIRSNQKLIRADYLNGVEEAIDKGETDPTSVGMRIILPSSFTGGRRYMFNNCQDAMAICKKFGYPDLFITATCNSSWKEIDRFVRSRNVRADERPDICCRVFKMKLNILITELKKGTIFGGVDAGMYTVEFQKRGLPHAHILLWLKEEHKMKSAADIDKLISAELPDPELYPKLSKVVSSYMMHGPCGTAEPKSPCMDNKKCSKYFPKKYQNCTTIDEDGYPIYRRRNSGIQVLKKGIQLDNGYVVPYNPQILMRYQGHINCEYCNKSNSIKYLFKYVNKGPDRVNVQIIGNENGSQNSVEKDEIKQYYDCRYLTPCEGVWRTFAFDIHHKWPPVQQLNFHLPNHQRVLFKDDDNLEDVFIRSSNKDTMFLSWMKANKEFMEGKDLTYAEFPNKFVFNYKTQEWQRRKKGFSIGRLQYVPPGVGELYYLRILLTVQKGCESFESIRSVNGVVYSSFHDACYALGLLADDREYIDAITEASSLGSGYQLRKLFTTLLTTSTMSKPDIVWEKTWRLLSDGILYERRRSLNIPGLQINDEDLMNLCLIEIEKLLHSNGRSLKEFSCLPYPLYSDTLQYENKFVADELNYNKEDMHLTHEVLLNSLTAEQMEVYTQIMKSVLSKNGGFFFLYGYGGTGKTFVWNTLSAALRSEGHIVLNVASSGIASLLLPGGRTAHSRFSIPISINELSTCNVKQGSQKAELLQKTSLIIWDEAPMLNKHCFEALDRTLNDIMQTQLTFGCDKPFGGKVVVLGGDFRQILPVIAKGSRSDIVSSTINSSYLWKHCKVLRLTTNMRLTKSVSCHSNSEIREFAEWILNVGDGKLTAIDEESLNIEIPSDLLIEDSTDPLLDLVNFAYPDMLHQMKNYSYFEERAILAPTLESVEKVNNFMLSFVPGENVEYLSYDTTCKSDEDSEIDGDWFTSEFLNDIKCSGIPNHKLNLKLGVPVMLLRNIDQSAGLCNGTRLIVTDLAKNVIGANVIAGNRMGEKVFIPRMNLIPSNSDIPIKFQRRQFPVTLCFGMTINKSQGQSLSHVGLYLPKPVFTHGQLYVALSRVKSRKGLKILILDDEGVVSNYTKNVVYHEVFDKI